MSTKIDNLPTEIIINIYNYINSYNDIISFKYLNKYYNNVFEQNFDGIVYIDDMDDYYSFIYYNILIYKKKYYNNVILITDIKQINNIDVRKLSYINFSHIYNNMLFNSDYLLFNTFLKYCINIKYLDIYGLDYELPDTLINLEQLELYECNIKRISNKLTKLRYLYVISDFTESDIAYIPKNIMMNLEYINIKNSYLKHDIYLSKNKIKFALIGINYKNYNTNNQIKINIIDTDSKITNLNNLINYEKNYFEYYFTHLENLETKL